MFENTKIKLNYMYENIISSATSTKYYLRLSQLNVHLMKQEQNDTICVYMTKPFGKH